MLYYKCVIGGVDFRINSKLHQNTVLMYKIQPDLVLKNCLDCVLNLMYLSTFHELQKVIHSFKHSFIF